MLAESWRTSATVAVSVACLILHTSEEAGMSTTQSAQYLAGENS